MDRESLEALRKRAYELADTGRFATWRGVADALDREGDLRPVTRIQPDTFFQHMLDSRCARAWDRNH